MARLFLEQDIRPLSEFRAKMTAFVKQVRKTHRPIVITHRGKSAAVLLNVFEYETLLDKVELFQDIRDAENEIEEGKGISHEAAKKQALRKLKKWK